MNPVFVSFGQQANGFPDKGGSFLVRIERICKLMKVRLINQIKINLVFCLWRFRSKGGRSKQLLKTMVFAPMFDEPSV